MEIGEVIQSLRHCAVNNNCRKCPSYKQDSGCLDRLHSEAADLLEAQQKRLEERWIPVTERLPEEHDSFLFASFYGTEKWQDGMFRKCSDTVLVSVEYKDGKRRVKAIITKDGKWDFSKFYRASKVTHWMPLPEAPGEDG